MPAAAPIAAHQPLQLRRCARPRECEQLALILGVSDARQRAHLRERQLTARHRLTYQWQSLERPCSAHLLTRRAQIDTGTEGEPVRAGAMTLKLPTLATVELQDQRQQSVRCSVYVRRERCDLITEILQRVDFGTVETRDGRGTH